MRELLEGFKDQLNRIFREKRYIILLVLFIMACWICMDVYRDMVVKDIPVAVLDFDNSTISRTIITHLSVAREIKLVKPEIYSVEDARHLLTTGELAAVVVMPSSLSVNLKKGRRSKVLVAIDMSNILLGKNAYKAIRSVVGMVAGGAQVTMVRKLGERKERTSAVVAPIGIDANYTFNPARNYVIYLIPGLLMFLLHVYIVIMAASPYVTEHPTLTKFRRTGQLFAVWLVGMLFGFFLFYVLMRYVAIVPPSSFGTVAFHLGAFLVLDILMVTFIMNLLPNRLQALQTVLLLAMLSMMFSGITWPTDMFPQWIAVIAQIIPFTPFAKAFQMFLHYPVALEETAHLIQWYFWQAVGYGGLLLLLLGLKHLFAKSDPEKHGEVSA